MFMIKIDEIGDTLWTRSVGTTGDDTGTVIRQANDGGYIISGWTESSGAAGKHKKALLPTVWTPNAGKPTHRIAAI